MRRVVLFAVCLISLFAAPVVAGPVCTTEWHTGSLSHVYLETDVWYQFRSVGSGSNNPGECLTQPYTCEIYQCDVAETSELPCKGDDTPISHCVRYLLEECSEEGKTYMPIIRELEFLSAGPCSLTP